MHHHFLSCLSGLTTVITKVGGPNLGWQKGQLEKSNFCSMEQAYLLTLSQTTDFRLLQTERVCRLQFEV